MKKVLLIAVVALCAAVSFAGETGSGAATDPDLLGRWRWISVTLAVDTVETGENSASYLLTFNADGSFEVRADCRTGNGRYTADGSMLTLSLNDMTSMNCGANTLAPELERLLREISNFQYKITNTNQLELGFATGTGNAQFLRVNDAM